MIKISKEELLKIAQISQLKLYDHEIESLIQQLQGVLTYAERVQQVVSEVEYPANKQVNVMREDVVISSDNEVLLEDAPEHEEGYFVVPKIIDK